MRGDRPPGDYDLLVSYPDQKATCRWLALPADYCIAAPVALSSPTLPEEAFNFDNKIAMLSVDVPQQILLPGGELPLTLTWLALEPMEDNYTVFVQVVDENDRIVGQVDAWPVQGTYPTSQWTAGETVADPYRVQLAADLSPGQYRVYIGWYLLETLRRLPVVDDNGQAIDDKFIYSGLILPE
jgi:hypothetical protein